MTNVINTILTEKPSNQKIATFRSDKNLQLRNNKIDDKNSLIFWIENYFDKMIFRGKEKTKKAK